MVLFNFRIDPMDQGGIQTSLLSILRSVHASCHGLRFKALAHPEHVDELQGLVGKNADVLSSTYREYGPITSEVHGALARWRERRLVPASLFDLMLRAYRSCVVRARTPSRFAMDRLLKSQGISVVHFGYPVTFPTSLPFVYEPHDLQHLHFPEFFPAEELVWRKRAYREGCRRAALVVCGSQWTKADVVDSYGVARERVAVIPRASAQLSSAVRDSRSPRELGLPDAYMIYPATTFEHKNHLRLIEAMASARDREGILLPLVCTGRTPEPAFSRIQASVAAYGLEEQVIFLGSLEASELRVALLNASFVVFPSLFEGLSQALLECLELGLSILAAEQTSIPETLGDAAIYFDGNDADALARCLVLAQKEPELLSKAQSRTTAQFRRYAWDAAAEKLVACYKRAAGVALRPEEQRALEEAVA